MIELNRTDLDSLCSLRASSRTTNRLRAFLAAAVAALFASGCGDNGGPCVAETDAAFCARLGKNCGTVSGSDNCGATRSVTSCGSCISPQACAAKGTANLCETPPVSLAVTLAGTGSGTVTSIPSGVGCSATCSASFDIGTAVALTATPASGSIFSGFSGDCSGATCSLTMGAAKNVTATFVKLHTLTVTAAGSGSGTVSSNTTPAISCTSSAGATSGTCSVQLPEGTAVTLTPAAASGSRFDLFSSACTGASCALSLNSDATVNASFIARIDVNVSFAGIGAGTVDFGGAATSCTADCTRTFDSGTSLTLGGTAATGSAFSGFSGSCTGSTCSLPSLSAAKNVTATFSGVYAIGGTVIGLSGSGLVLGSSINGGAAEQLAVSANGSFVFPTKALGGETYAVSVVTQPGTPAQTCVVATGTDAGTATADVTTVEIDCPPFVVASGLDGPGTLAVNGSTLYFGVSIYPNVTDCYTGNPAAGDRVMMVSSAGGTPTMIDYIDHYAGNCGLYGMVFDSSYVYWANYSDGVIKRATLAGANPSLVNNAATYTNALVIDPGGTNLYYHAYPNTSLGRVPTAGTGNTTFANASSINGENLAIDSNYLYWTDYGEGTVNQVPLDATPLPATPTNIATDEIGPLAPFVTSSTIYWVQPGFDGALRYAALASPSAASLNTSPLSSPASVLVDANYAWVLAFGASDADGRIYKIPASGGAPVIVAQGLFQPSSITMDAGHIYWTNNNTTQSDGTRNSDGTIMMIVK